MEAVVDTTIVAEDDSVNSIAAALKEIDASILSCMQQEVLMMQIHLLLINLLKYLQEQQQLCLMLRQSKTEDYSRPPTISHVQRRFYLCNARHQSTKYSYSNSTDNNKTKLTPRNYNSTTEEEANVGNQDQPCGCRVFTTKKIIYHLLETDVQMVSLEKSDETYRLMGTVLKGGRSMECKCQILNRFLLTNNGPLFLHLFNNKKYTHTHAHAQYKHYKNRVRTRD
jgi:hypothetical protein